MNNEYRWTSDDGTVWIADGYGVWQLCGCARRFIRGSKATGKEIIRLKYAQDEIIDTFDDRLDLSRRAEQ